MTWATTVGVDGRRQQETTWVMMWAMMWAMGTMVATTPATMPAKGMARMLAGRGGEGLLVEDTAAAAAVAMRMAAAAAYCRGHMLFIVKILFLCGIFMMCGGNWQGHTSPHTLIMLEVCRHMYDTFGWGWKLSSKIVVCKYQKLASKKAWQPKLVVFYTKVLGTKKNPSHCRNWYCVPKTPIRDNTNGHLFSRNIMVINCYARYPKKSTRKKEVGATAPERV
jgi:hypothetical protein